MITEAVVALVNFDFQHPTALWVIPAAAVILLLLLTRDFVKTPLQPEERRRQRRRRVWLFVSRLLLLILVAIALAQPYSEVTKQVQGNPRLTVLLDTSSSMRFLDTSFAKGLTDILGRSVSTTFRTVGTNGTSDLGNGLLQNLEPGGNVLLISDFNPTSGPKLSDVAFYATTLNATVSAINLSTTTDEGAVMVLGPSKVVADSDATFTVFVTATTPDRMTRLTVSVDGNKILDKDVAPGDYSFTHQFLKGDHRIEAAIAADTYAGNDVFYKTVHVLPKPKILLISQRSSPLEILLRQVYDVDKKASLPADLSPYYAVVTDDASIESLRNTQALHDFLIDEQGDYYGGGFVLFGGMDSFDRGSYSSSTLEPLLPVKVGKGERKKGNANLVFVIDVSGTTSRTKYLVQGGQLIEYNETLPTIDVIKAQVVNAIEQLQLDNKVGVIVFGINPGAGHDSAEEALADSVRILQPLDYLYNDRKEILDKVPRIIGGGPVATDVAFRGAVDMLRDQQGDKTIILVSDGRYSPGLGAETPLKRELLTLAANAKRQYGINLMTIGVGTEDEQLFPKKVDEAFLKELAAAGDGTYDRATRLNTLLIKWGDPKAKEFGEEFNLVLLSLTHFITRGVEPTAMLNAYNQVVPKDTAELLIAADSGQPALTVWHYGNGRVATWTVFAGNNLGQLLNGNNSLLLTRTVNWAIGDPQRKEAFYVDIPDTRTDAKGIITVRSATPVSSEGLEFTKEGDTYTSSFQAAEPGFGQLLGKTYAVNGPAEMDRVGLNPDIEAIVTSTGGKTFKPSDDQAMIQFVKEASKRVTLERQVLVLPFLWAALLILLLEIGVRRITERRRRA